jgi:hypothetical protein
MKISDRDKDRDNDSIPTLTVVPSRRMI